MFALEDSHFHFSVFIKCDIYNFIMKIFVSAKPNATDNNIEKIDETHFVVAVTEPPIKGHANRAILKILAEYFNVSLYNIKIKSGYTSRNKIIEIT